MSAAGIILCDSYDIEVADMTKERTLAAMPFGGRYVVIDFTLSNMGNAGISNIGIITTRNYISVMEHIRGGNVWDLDTKRTGVTFLPPYASDESQHMYGTRLEALQAHQSFLEGLEEEYLVIVSCNYIGNIDLEKMLKSHLKSGAAITAMYTRKPMFKSNGLEMNRYLVGEDGYLTGIEKIYELTEGDALGVDCFVCKRVDLMNMLKATERAGKSSLRKDVLEPLIRDHKVIGYEAESSLLFTDDTSGYLQSSLALLDRDLRVELFEQPRFPVITRALDSAPGEYGDDSVVSNCLIADGVKIDGTVKNSVIFRGAVIKKGAVVENSVIMRDTVVGENARLSYVILDNNVVVGDDRSLGGYITHPFYLEKGTVI